MSMLPIDLEWLALGVAGAVAVLFTGLWFYLWLYREWTLPFRNVDGPKPSHFLWGNISEIIKAGPDMQHSVWRKEFGLTYRYRVLFGSPRFYSADPVALSYILGHTDKFPKPPQMRKNMADMLGNGVLIAEGHDHRRQRKILNPSFSASAVRDMIPVFYDKAFELRDKLVSLIEDDNLAAIAAPTPAKPEDVVPGARKIDVLKFLGMATIDVIGIAGFNYDFRALHQPRNELAEAFRDMFSAGQNLTVMGIIQALVPGADLIPTKRMRTIWASQATTRRIGKRLIEEKKKAIRQQHAGGLEKGDDIGTDMLSLCIRANMAADLKPDQKLTDEEVLAQITTFMLAGNETSSTALTWILWQLALHPELQDRLREECQSVDDERPSIETVSALPYMDAVVREGLRLLPPAPSTVREASEDAVVPLGTPINGRDGKMIDSIRLNKGTTIFVLGGCEDAIPDGTVAIMAVNHSTEIWGADALEFNPDRFARISSDSDPEKAHIANQVPGVWGNLLTFLGGTRNCIGYRFALAEIKVILFVLMRSFTFENLPSKPEIEKKTAIVMRPRIKGEEAAGLQMPLLVKPISA
ncbi:hypothetical protein EHS25_000211 [Saitozyma podzolica]|uniref:Cytochrome P450-dit2 n=1 Tax=Saitozyma podzolica TaxID=1890683 RepID=A0A427YVU3_9TREE|nr:hypothetical protein EHS25_000211 [Saitozyma podzolica]